LHNLSPGVTKRAALEYAARGWHVFPIVPRAKNPLTTHGHLEATTDPEWIERLWRDHGFANVGIATGPSGLLVADVDTKPGKSGAETWAALEALHGPQETYEVRSWSGGRHLFYEDPYGLTNSSGTGKPGERALGRHIDTRGAGGYVVAAPSIVREGDDFGQYEVVAARSLLLVPAWIRQALEKPERETYVPTGPVAGEDEVHARVRLLATELTGTQDGANHNAARLAYMAGQYVGAGQIPADEVIGILQDAVAGWTWAAPRDAETMTRTIISQVTNGAANPRPWEANGNGAVVTLAPPSAPVPAAQTADPEEEAEANLSMWATDNGQGVFLRDRIGNMLYAVGVGWMVWDKKRWKPVAPEFIQNKISRFYRRQFEKVVDQYKETLDTKYEGLAKTYRAFMSSARLASIMSHLKVTDGVLVEASALDSHPHLLNCQNGIVDLRTGELSRHEPTLLMTKITAGKYIPGFKHEDWEAARTSLPSEVADYMQIRLGQAVTGNIPPSDDAVFLIGTGSNGKSSWASEGVLRAVGDYGILAAETLITRSTESSGATPERMALRGCRFVVIEELPEGRSLAIASIKRITGMSVITARDLYKDLVTYNASHTLFVSANYDPTVAEVDEGSWRRLCKIVFPYQFKTVPDGPGQLQGRSGLKEALRNGTDGQHDAILSWLVAGAIRYYADPDAIMDDRRPAPVVAATLAWRKEADRILAYVDERLAPAEGVMVFRGDLYSDFCAFLEASGHAKWSQETFLSRFRTHAQIRAWKVTEKRTRAVGDICRPVRPGVAWSSSMPAMPAQPQVFEGIRFVPQT
jgi:putative DNA primase/helicase